MVSRTEILEHAAAGSLHQLILDKYERGNDDDDAAIQNLAVALHNDGEIDLVAALTPEAHEAIKGFGFFTVQQFYCAVIPRLEADAVSLMGAVSGLVEAAGEDGASTWPNGAFRDWCSARPDRPALICELAEGGEPLSMSHLTFALEAGAKTNPSQFVSKAIGYLRDAPDLRLSALTALSRYDCRDDVPLAKEAMAAITELLGGEADDMLRTHIFRAAVGLYARVPSELHDLAETVMRDAIAEGGDGVLHQCATVLFEHRNTLSAAMIALLLDSLEELNPANLGTVNALDIGLAELLKSNQSHDVIGFLERLLRHHDQLSFENFDSVGRALLQGEATLREDIAVRWLMSGETSLADSISTLLGNVGGSQIRFAVDLHPYALSDSEVLFLARKAVGWFFFHPITAASLLICIIRSANEETGKAVGDLLFEPLLLNFSGELREYLETCAGQTDDPAGPEIKRALGRLDSYLDDLRTTGYINELAPSERERLIELQQSNERMRQIQKEAEAKSVLMSIIPKSIILYGNGSVTYRKDVSGELHRHVIKMGGFSTTWEAPRLQTIDPLGLELQIGNFRAEARPQ